MSSRFLITGAQGFAGRYLAAQLLSAARGAEILGVGRSPRNGDRFTHAIHWGATRLAAPLPEELSHVDSSIGYQYIAVDICDCARLMKVMRDFRPQIIIHLASALRDDPPESLSRTNIEGTVSLVEAIGASGIEKPKLIVGSTGGVYGVPSQDELPLSEDSPCRPIDPYSISKLAAEQASRALVRLRKIPAIWARLFNLVGPGQDERHVCGKFAGTIAAIIVNGLPRKIAVGALDKTRDFLDVRDAVQGLHILAERGSPGETYNVGSGTETSIESVLSKTLHAAGLTGGIEINRVSARAQDIPRHFANVERLKALGFEPRYNLDRSIEDLLRYYIETVAEKQPRPASSRYAG
jgi:nucleoside-diphosphate-sugar epimerase